MNTLITVGIVVVCGSALLGLFYCLAHVGILFRDYGEKDRRGRFE